MAIRVRTATETSEHEFQLVDARLDVRLTPEYREKTRRIMKKDLPQMLSLRLLYDAVWDDSPAVTRAQSQSKGLQLSVVSFSLWTPLCPLALPPNLPPCSLLRWTAELG